MPSLIENIEKQSIQEFERYMDGTIRRNELDLSRYKTPFLRFVLYRAKITKRVRLDIEHELNSRKQNRQRKTH